MTKLESLYQEWQSLQPLKEEDQRRLDQKFMLEFNYNSNHIEGNTLTYGQTELLLLFGRVVGEAKMKDLEEMKAHNVCLKMVKEAALDKDHVLTEYFIRTLHQVMLREDYTVYVWERGLSMLPKYKFKDHLGVVNGVEMWYNDFGHSGK